MLARARTRIARARLGSHVSLVRGDIRDLPFKPRVRFSAVLAAYGILQSLTRERDLTRTFESVARVLKRGGLFAIDVVPDLPKWEEYRNRVSLTGRRGRGTTLTLVETVRQDRRRRLTIFDQEYRETAAGRRRTHRFSLTFRTLSVPQMTKRLERAGFRVKAVLGDYQGGPWDPRADVWVILAAKR
jgi:SAM-dependent methyltransferase